MISKKRFYPKDVIENIIRLSNSENSNIRRVYSQFFNLKKDLPEEFSKGNFEINSYLSFKKEILKGIDKSHVDFVSDLFKIKKI